jgi:hypothetical protein
MDFDEGGIPGFDEVVAAGVAWDAEGPDETRPLLRLFDPISKLAAEVASVFLDAGVVIDPVHLPGFSSVV